jgi:hypothetical protein
MIANPLTAIVLGLIASGLLWLGGYCLLRRFTARLEAYSDAPRHGPGDIICGRLIIHARRRIIVRAARVTLQCRRRTDHRQGGSDRGQTSWLKVHEETHPLIADSINLMRGEIREFPFEVPVPAMLNRRIPAQSLEIGEVEDAVAHRQLGDTSRLLWRFLFYIDCYGVDLEYELPVDVQIREA